MPAEIATVFLSLIAAVFWGGGDFTGGLTTKRVDVFVVVTGAHFVGLVLFLVIALASGEALPSTADLLWSVVAGVSGVIGLAAFYRGLAQESMGLMAPITGVLATCIPVMFTLLTDGFPEALTLFGFLLALVSVWLVSRGEGSSVISRTGLQLALIAALGFGGFLILINQTESTSVVWILTAARVGSTGFMLLLAQMLKRPFIPTRHDVPAVITVGLLDLGGNAFFILAGQQGRLDVAAVLSSLYPAVTIILAHFILKERVSRLQSIGILSALAAIMLIAL